MNCKVCYKNIYLIKNMEVLGITYNFENWIEKRETRLSDKSSL